MLCSVARLIVTQLKTQITQDIHSTTGEAAWSLVIHTIYWYQTVAKNGRQHSYVISLVINDVFIVGLNSLWYKDI